MALPGAILCRHFPVSKLNPGQTDVALRLPRRLTIEQIAPARDCAADTVKAHQNALYRAGRFATPGEQSGFFMNELLVHGINGTAPDPRLTSS